MTDETEQSQLGMTPREMRRLAARATEILIERIGSLGEANAWDGEFRAVLEQQFGARAPEAADSPRAPRAEN